MFNNITHEQLSWLIDGAKLFFVKFILPHNHISRWRYIENFKFFFSVLFCFGFIFIIDLRIDYSCISNSDVIQIYDGIDSNADLIQQICGHIAFLEILSSTNQLYVEFISPPNTPKQQSAKGFKAEYSFIPVTALIQPGTLSLSPFTPPLMNYFPSSSSSSSGIQYPWLIGE